MTISVYGDRAARSEAAYKAMRFVPENQKLIRADRKFAQSADAALKALVAIEQKNPGLVPAGFRDELAANPLDATVRLHMARCEVLVPALVRRGRVDLAAALLAGASADEVYNEAMLVKFGRGCLYHSQSDAENRACDAKIREFEEGEPKSISAQELACEDAVSRGMAKIYAAAPAPDDAHQGISGLLSHLMHRCGSSGACLAEITDHYEYAALKPTHELVHRDRRDGGGPGSVVEIPDTPEIKAAKSRCRTATGYEAQQPCLQGCFGPDEARCRTVCIANCVPAG